MKTAVETLNPTRVKLTVEVPFDELKKDLDAAYKLIGSQIQVPGFRKGHVPTRIIDQRVGRGAVLQEAVNEALPRLYSQAVHEHELRALGQPDVEVTEVPVEDGQPLAFTAEVEQTYYRVAQEALDNVVRHAGASEATLRLQRDNNALVLEVRDDGRGMSPERDGDRYGLQGMRERAELIGATLEVASTPEAGTTVRLVKELGR